MVKDEQIQTLGDNNDVVDIGAIHHKVMVMSSPHVMNPYFETIQQNEALHCKVMVMLGPHSIDLNSKNIVQDETLHCKVMVMSSSYLISSQAKTNDIPLKKTSPWNIILDCHTIILMRYVFFPWITFKH